MRRLRVPLVPRWLRWSAVLFVAATVFYFSVLVSPGPAGRANCSGRSGTNYLHAVAYAGSRW